MAESEFEKKAAQAVANVTAKSRATSFPRPEDLAPGKFERNRIGLKAAFGLLFVTNAVVIGFLLVTDPNSRYSPYHHTRLMRKHQPEQQSAPDTAKVLEKA